ncbi:MAG: outer membrane beta-barrel protein [Hyphomonas sp.]|nr:outer membrane beta-barrel protein [Hyphomonas sp.]
MNNLKRFSLLTVASGAMITSLAGAQGQNDYYSREKYEAVSDRYQPAFDPEPIRVGAFRVNATGIVGATASSNVYATPTNEESDVIARVGGNLDARTDWSAHEVGASLSAFHNEYLDFSDESYDDLRGELRGRLDVTREFALGASAFAETSAEQRTDPANTNGLAAPIEYDRSGATLEANYRNDRVRWQNAVSFTQVDFEDGRQIGTNAVVDTSFRDSETTEGRSRLSYAVTPNLAVFGQGTVRELTYDNDQLIAGALHSRDSDGYTLAGGLDFELTALVRGDIAVGYMSEDKKDPFFEDVDGLSVDGRMLWFPSRLTTATFTAGRQVIDVGDIDSPSVVQTRLGGRLDHELRRNVILSGELTYADYDYQESDRSDEVTSVQASVLYKMNKKVHVEAYARRRDREASGSALVFNPDYGVSTFGVQLRLHP